MGYNAALRPFSSQEKSRIRMESRPLEGELLQIRRSIRNVSLINTSFDNLVFG